MKIGDLVKVKEWAHSEAPYGIIIYHDWKGDVGLVGVVLNGDNVVLPFYRYELEVISEGRGFSKI